MEPQEPIRYTHSRDGTTIAWSSIGSGPALIYAPSWPVTMSTASWNLFIRPWWPWTIVTYDRRGFGASEWHVEHSLERYADDLEAVADAANMDTFVVMAAAAGTAESIVLSARTPRITRMMLVGPAWKAMKDLYVTQRSLMALIDQDFLTFWRATMQSLFGWGKRFPGSPEAMAQITNPTDVRALNDILYNKMDLSPYAPLVQADCLVVDASWYTDILPAAAPIELCRHIPNARLVVRGPDTTPEELALDRQFMLGDRAVNEAVTSSTLPPAAPVPHPDRLTAREFEILLAVAEGLSNEAIADRFTLSKATVARHLANIYGKLGVRNRVEATNWAAQQAKRG